MLADPKLWSLTLALAATTGCRGASCGQTGCLGTVDLLLSEPLASAATYVVDLQLGSADTVRCTVTLPHGTPACDQRWADLLVHPDGGLEGVVLYRTEVESVGVSVARNGTVIGGGTYRPEYERWFPNGPSCDAEPCRHALVEVGVVAKAADPRLPG